MFEDKKFIIGERYEALSKRLASKIFSDMEEFTSKSIEDISKDYWNNREGYDKQIQASIDRCVSQSQVIDYYKTTPQYLYELGYWEAQKDKQREFKKLYLALKRFGISSVLDYGGGIGGLAIYLTLRGIECDYLDIPGKTFDFAKFRFNKLGLKIRMFDNLNLKAFNNYGAVICYDVLEHVFDLEKTVETIGNLLKEDGLFIHRSTFGTGGIHLIKHTIYQDFGRLNRLLESSGFKFIGRIKADYLSNLLQKMGLRYALLGIRLSKKMKYGGNFLLHKKSSK